MTPFDVKSISRVFRLYKNVDPRVYTVLISLVEQRLAEITKALTEAPPDQILVCQGRAQEARKFLLLMTELPEDTSAPQQPPTRPGP
jgi:hypothetical protein